MRLTVIFSEVSESKFVIESPPPAAKSDNLINTAQYLENALSIGTKMSNLE